MEVLLTESEIAEIKQRLQELQARITPTPKPTMEAQLEVLWHLMNQKNNMVTGSLQQEWVRILCQEVSRLLYIAGMGYV